MKDKQFENKIGNDIADGITEIVIMFVGMMILMIPCMAVFYL